MYKKSVKFICEYKNEYFKTMCDVNNAGTLERPDFVQARNIYNCPICDIGKCDNTQCNLHTQGAKGKFYSQI